MPKGTIPYMVGDWVFHKAQNKNMVVRGTDGDDFVSVCIEDGWTHIDNVEPIPITGDILARNGFVEKRYAQDSIKNEYMLILAEGGYESANLFVSFSEIITFFKIRCVPYGKPQIEFYKRSQGYVHELQHAMRMIGIDKEITL